MKTQAMDKAKTVASDCLYPFKHKLGKGYPSTQHFEVVRTADGEGAAIKKRITFDSRVCIANISGYALSERRQHTLQLSSRIHLYDCWFCGLFPIHASRMYFSTCITWKSGPCTKSAPAPR